jgi:CBS domain-containing protein
VQGQTNLGEADGVQLFSIALVSRGYRGFHGNTLRRENRSLCITKGDEMLVREILAYKGHAVHTCHADDTLSDVVASLMHHNCGSLIVMNGDEMVGIIFERDILRSCKDSRGRLDFVQVSERMTRDPITARLDDEVACVMGVMTENRIRHLPVVDQGRLCGLISIGDVVKAHHNELCQENHYLKTYILS